MQQRHLKDRAKIVAAIGAAKYGAKRPYFSKGPFFRDIPVDKAYARDAQQETLFQILKDKALVAEYIPQTGSNFLSRGHLIAMGDFMYESLQRATFYYVNTVPMWHSINAGNWKKMEESVRSYASNHFVELDVWAGGYGVLTLNDRNNEKKEIYLYVNKKNQRSVPVPKVLFKVVYHGPTRSGVVFLTANNPKLKTIPPEYVICKDVCGQIEYLTWNAKTPEYGLSYCCEIDDFRRAFPGIPDFVTKQLLL